MVSELKQSREHHLISGDPSPDWLDIKSCFSVRRWAGQGLGWGLATFPCSGDVPDHGGVSVPACNQQPGV